MKSAKFMKPNGMNIHCRRTTRANAHFVKLLKPIRINCADLLIPYSNKLRDLSPPKIAVYLWLRRKEEDHLVPVGDQYIYLG